MIASIRSRNTLYATLYGGIALIVISMLFLTREVQTDSFLVHALVMLAAPAIFYAAGGLVLRYLDAPLAGPGIIATGAWLVGVSLIHLNDQRDLLPEILQPYYWLIASLLTVGVITLTGHRVLLWLIVPLVPLVQVNAWWTLLSVLGLPLAWWTPLTFLVVIGWWELPSHFARIPAPWTQIYRTSATLLTICLIVMSYTLNTATTETIVITWVTGALVVAFLGVRQGWVNFGPLAIAMLFCATLWGIAPVWWSPAWLALATITVILMEQQPRNHDQRGAIELSVALAILLSGGAALFSVLAVNYGVTVPPLLRALVLFEAGVLLAGLGWRRGMAVAAHVGLWLLAAAWTQLYLVWFPTSNTFGVWLGVLAAVALLAERLTASAGKRKQKPASLLSTVMRWPIADLALGLTGFMILWTFVSLPTAPPLLLAITAGEVVGIWLIAGLIYRLPPLLHIALWIAPLPYALLLMYVLPPLRHLPLIGFSWQVLGVAFVLIGHSLYRQRPAMVLPFFAAGYIQMNLSLLLTVANPWLFPLSLAVPMLVSLLTALTVMLNRHPAWTALVSGIINPNDHPFAFRNLHNLFLLHGAGIAVVWVHILFNFSGLSFAQQGIGLVLLSAGFVAIGRLLPRFGETVGWHVYGAGWLLWLSGLVVVYPFATEALITVILGLAISTEAVYRAREIYWLPVLILQLLFSALQITRLLVLPEETVLLALAVGVSLAGMWTDHLPRPGEPYDLRGRIAALCASGLTLTAWLVLPSATTAFALVIVLASGWLRYRDWRWLLAIQSLLTIEALRAQVGWEWWLAAAAVELSIGAVLAGRRQPRVRRYTMIQVIFDTPDQVTPFLWGGSFNLLTGAMLQLLSGSSLPNLALTSLIVTGIAAVFALLTGLRYAPRLAVQAAGATLLLVLLQQHQQPYHHLRSSLPLWSLGITLVALSLYAVVTYAVASRRPLVRARRLVWWLRPLWGLHYFSGYTAFGLWILQFAYTGGFTPVNLLTGGLLGLWGGLRYTSRRQAAGLWFVLVVSGFTWMVLAGQLRLHGPLFMQIPFSIGVLILARMLPARYSRHLDYMVLGSLYLALGVSYTHRQMYGTSLLLLTALQLPALMIYGYLGRRRTLFAGSLAGVAAGGVYLLASVSLWLLPLLIGTGLLLTAVSLEVAREPLERWLQTWFARWS